MQELMPMSVEVVVYQQMLNQMDINRVIVLAKS